MRTYDILGVKFHDASMAQALETLTGFLDGDKSCLVVTVGPEMVMRAQENKEFRDLVEGADLVVPDGTGILWAASQCGYKLPERVAGIDLAVNFAGILAEKNMPLFMLGAAPGIAEKAADKLRQRFPKLVIAGTHDGYFKDHDEVVKQIAASGAKAIYVAMGSPAQEKWVRQHGEAMGIKVGIGLGGSFDVLSGMKKRAPVWMQKLRLEWLYRFICEPSRIGRMMAIPKFMLKVFRNKPAVKVRSEERV